MSSGWSPNPGDTPTPVVEGSGCRLVNQHLRREQRKRLTMSISGLEPIRRNSSSVHRSVKAGRRPPRRGLALRDREVIGATLADQARQGLMGAAGLGERPRDAGGPTKGAEDPQKRSPHQSGVRVRNTKNGRCTTATPPFHRPREPPARDINIWRGCVSFWRGCGRKNTMEPRQFGPISRQVRDVTDDRVRLMNRIS